jgi:hypothetical protein
MTDFTYAENLIIENNIITLEQPSGEPRNILNSEIFYQGCKNVKSFNNQDRSGKLLVPYDRTNSRHVNELETDAEDWILMYLLNK